MHCATALTFPGGIGGGKYSRYYTLFLVSSWVRIFLHCISRSSSLLTLQDVIHTDVLCFKFTVYALWKNRLLKYAFLP